MATVVYLLELSFAHIHAHQKTKTWFLRPIGVYLLAILSSNNGEVLSFNFEEIFMSIDVTSW